MGSAISEFTGAWLNRESRFAENSHSSAHTQNKVRNASDLVAKDWEERDTRSNLPGACPVFTN
jgi:hypothetical protein